MGVFSSSGDDLCYGCVCVCVVEGMWYLYECGYFFVVIVVVCIYCCSVGVCLLLCRYNCRLNDVFVLVSGW